MKKETVVFIESNTTGTGELFIDYCRELGYNPVLLTSDINRYSDFFKENTESIEVDTNNIEKIESTLKELEKNSIISGITSSSDYYIYSAAVLAKQMDLKGPNPDSVISAKNKFFQRLKLKESGIGNPKFFKAETSKKAVEKAEYIGYPVVVKPVLASGSEGVKLCKDAGSVSAHADLLLKIKANPRGQKNPNYILVEEYIEGEEYSVESFGFKEDLKIIGITKKYVGEKPSFVEIGHDYPADIKDETANSIKNVALEALKAIGLTWGPAHTEIRIGKKGPVIIEINPRLAGGMIPKLINLVQGIDIIKMTLKEVINIENSSSIPPSDGFASIGFLIPDNNGVIKEIMGIEKARDITGVADVSIYQKKLKNFSEIKGDFNDRIGHIVVKGNSVKDNRELIVNVKSNVEYSYRR